MAQPFREPFQGRFDEDIEPAIWAAGMTAYKVDKDLAADKLVEDIHRGIELATVVLVDITEDNPNVWYELGYSQALKKPLVMISCSTERGAGTPYPFDVRGRKVDDYQTGRTSDHQRLRECVTARLGAILERALKMPGTSAPTTQGEPAAVGEAQPAANNVDALNLIRQKARETVHPGHQATVLFSLWDSQLRLPAGTTGRLINQALTYPFLVTSKGNITAVISQEDDVPF